MLALFAFLWLAMPTLAGPPNVVVILADDMGFGDVAAQNPTTSLKTPHLDSLARDGVRFSDAHSPSAVCTPTRYGLLTGRYCWRTWLKTSVLFTPRDKPLLNTDRLTLAEFLRQRGYHTACVSKWHLGIDWGRDAKGAVDFDKPFKHGPTDVGFDEFLGRRFARHGPVRVLRGPRPGRASLGEPPTH